MNRITPLLIGLLLLAAACGDDGNSTTTTTTGDTGARSPVFVDSVEFIYLESYPVQVRAIVSGSLPTPCHELAWALDDSDATAPSLDIWSTVDPDVTCAQVLEPFEETIDVGSYETGEYVLEVGGEPYPFEI